MKKYLRIINLLLLISIMISVASVCAFADAEPREELRGVWVATVLNIDYPSKPTTDSEVLKAEALKILDDAKNMGLNAIFLQVRPASDALYKSDIFPWSKYLTGSQGTMPDNNFDPLKFWTEEAHKRGIELHAWINPYRVTKKSAGEAKHDFASLDPSNPARLRPELVVKHTDGNLYYNPGLPEVRELIIKGVLEIVENYDIDGIHLDDYFYPDKNFDDKAAFQKYGAGYKNVDDWRRANVNMLVSDLSKTIKAARPDVRFGISPFGIWANKDSNPLGSDTRGMQTYYDQYADSRGWVKERLLDYIAPQLYWNIGYAIADYAKLLDWWSDVVSGTGVDLYIGHAAYRSVDAGPSSPWHGGTEVIKQLQMNSNNPEVKGSIFFSNRSLVNCPELSAAIGSIYKKKDEIPVSIPVVISRPAENIRTSLDKYYLNGSSDPKKPLYLNGSLVENRSPKGYFGILVPLREGDNTFTFSQEGSSATCTIYRYAAASKPAKMSKAEILTGSVFPQAQEYRMPGEKITLSCKAPAGSKVSVSIGGKSYGMKPSGKAVGASGLYEDTYSYVYTIPDYSGTPRIIDLGAPVYTMDYNGKKASLTAPAKVGVIMKGASFYAKVEKDVINTYNSASSSNGAAYELYKGMNDYVTGMTGSFIRLSIGQWVRKDDVVTYTAKTRLNASISSAAYDTGDWWDTMTFITLSPVMAIADFDGTALKLTVSPASTGVLPVLPESSPFSSIELAKKENSIEYILTLKDGHRIEGYYVQKTPTGIALNIKRPVWANDGNKPLAGIQIMLDPGHGGSDPGATGPLGLKYPEKTINLNIAQKLKDELEKLGARVVMTRTEDKDVSLDERLTASRKAKPDLFISLHANSMADDVDISKIDGFSVFYRENHSKLLAETVFKNVLEDLSRNNKGLHNRNFYVTRGTWTPSVLIESGFVPNPHEFEWLTDEKEQARLAECIANAVLEYFK